LDSRLLVEHLSGHNTPLIMRARDRVRLSCSPGSLKARLFGSVEAFAAPGHGLVERRYQVGAVRSVGPATVEAYWLERRISGRPVFNGIGVTASFRIGMP
jgi:hypothetical protein